MRMHQLAQQLQIDQNIFWCFILPGSQHLSWTECHTKLIHLIDYVKLAKFNDKLKEVNWSELEGIDDANIAYNTFIETFVYIYNDCFRQKKGHKDCQKLS